MSELAIKLVEGPQELQEAKAVRLWVFHFEQGISPEIDFDQHDTTATHVIAIQRNAIVGTARIRFPKHKTRAKIERLAVLKGSRGQGLGKALMEFIAGYLKENGVVEAYLDSQEHARGFYERLGYQQEGPVFEEVGIPHIKMTKRFDL